MVNIYGIKNCDTMKKAITWLELKMVSAIISMIIKKKTYQKPNWRNGFTILTCGNSSIQKGMTWKQLPDEVKESIKDKTSAIRLMMEKTSLIKRPLVEMNDGHLLGFQESEWSKTFSK